jgi:catechol 2,3-dioxygenase-like lactoylglutathione lyase family enzyme
MSKILNSAICILFMLSALTSNAQSEFSSATIQIGVVVTDLEVSKDFYTKIIGMKETGGFDVPGAKAKTLGLTDGIKLEVAVLKLEDTPNATQWKLMSFGGQAAHPKQSYINNDTGVQYITIFVTSLAPVLKRIKANNIKTLGDTASPQPIDDGLYFVMVQDPDGTFIELIGKL